MKIGPTFTARTALANFAPWIIYGILSALGHQTWAYAGGWVTSLFLGIPQWRARRGIKALDGVCLLFFFAGSLFTSVFRSSLFEHDGSCVIWSLFALVVWGSLLAGSPFTAQYARESVPQAYWDNPGFRRVNVAITAVWGSVFTLNAALATVIALRLQGPLRHAGIWLQAGSYAGIALGILFTNRYPQWVSQKSGNHDLPTGNLQ